MTIVDFQGGALRKRGWSYAFFLTSIGIKVDWSAETLTSVSGFPYTGHDTTDEILDDPELMRRLLEAKETLHALGPEERREKRAEMLESGDLISWQEVRERQRLKRGS